ncbi:MAG: PolC-type DNA polymerase III [Paraclostridium sp.]
MKSILKDVIYLNLITTGFNPNSSEIIEIAAIKVTDCKISKFSTLIKPFEEVSASVFGMCKNLKMEELDKSPTIYQIKNKLIEFIEDYPIIFYDLNFQKVFMEKYIFTGNNYKNELLDSMQLAMILEPYHKDYSINYLLENITKLNKVKQNRALYDCILNINIINSLLLRLFKNEESRLDKLYFNLDQYFQTANLPKWE